MPSGDIATVRTIERDSSTCNLARAGDNVAIGLHGIDPGHIVSGGVLCHPDFPVHIASHLELKILVLEITMPILVGLQVSGTAQQIACQGLSLVRSSYLLFPSYIILV
jgi:elongation factor 1 alpha-like protein